MQSQLKVASILTKCIPLVAIFLLTIGGTSAEAREWEAFFARVNSSKSRVNYDGSLRIESGAEGLWLKSDGRYADTDSGIGTAQNFDAYCNDLPKRCGNFRYENGKYILWNNSYPDRATEVYSFSPRDKSLIDGRVVYQYIPPVKNYRLNGSYRYASSRISGAIFSFDSSGRFAVRKKNTATQQVTVRPGRYTINGYSMFLQYDDGETDVQSFYIIDNFVFFDGDWYERLK